MDNCSLLVVDDEPSIHRFLTAALSPRGYDVTALSAGAEAVKLLESRKFDVAIVDLFMPGMDGSDTLAALKAVDPDLEVIIATGNASTETAVSCLKRGACDYIAKPFRVPELIHLLARAVERRRLQARAALYEMSRVLLASSHQSDFASVVARLACEVTRCDSVAFARMPAPAGAWEVSVEPAGAPAPPVAMLAECAAHGLERSEPQHRHGDRGSWLICPLGAQPPELMVLGRGPGLPSYDAADVRRAGQFSALVALALDNHRLFARLNDTVAETVKAQQHLEESRSRLRAILDSSQDAVFRLDAEGRIRNLNRMAIKMFGRTRDEVRDRPFADLIATGKDRDHLAARLREYRRGGGDPVEGELLESRAVRKDGEEFAAEVWIAVSRTERDENYSAFVRDVSQRKQLEVELRHSQKLESVGRLASGIAHEINTPIQFVADNTRFLQQAFTEIAAVLAGYRDALRRAGEGAAAAPLLADLQALEHKADVEYFLSEVPTSIEQTLDGVERVATIVRAMKDFAHAGAGKKSFADLNKAIQSTLVVARNELKYVADVETDFAELPPVHCHIGDLNQVFLNLFVNAAHAITDVVGDSGQRGRITVRTAAEGDTIVISVSDTGTGIAEDIRERVFDPFFTTKEVGKGTGQGLALVRSIVVDKHGGSVRLESEVGRGTTFFVRLPLQREEAVAL